MQPRAADDLPQLVLAWLAAAAEPEIARALEGLYTELGEEIASRGPTCWSSGRCCNFEAYGHRLYVTGLEAAYLVHRLSPPGLSQTALAAAVARGGCPFQQGNLCGVHALRPLGCRVFFCDKSAQEWQNPVYERFLSRLRALHEERGIEYRYVEWRALLAPFAGAEDDRQAGQPAAAADRVGLPILPVR